MAMIGGAIFCPQCIKVDTLHIRSALQLLMLCLGQIDVSNQISQRACIKLILVDHCNDEHIMCRIPVHHRRCAGGVAGMANMTSPLWSAIRHSML